MSNLETLATDDAQQTLAIVEREHTFSKEKSTDSRVETLTRLATHNSEPMHGRLSRFIFDILHDLRSLGTRGRPPSVIEMWTVLTSGDRAVTLGAVLLIFALVALCLHPRKV